MENADAPGQLTVDSPTPRERVAAEAAERFLARGYQAVGLREIAKALDPQAATLYHHFPRGKPQLYAESVCATLDGVHHGLTDASAGAENLNDALGAMADWLLDAPPLDLQRILDVDRPALGDAHAQTMLTEAVDRAVMVPFIRALGMLVRGATTMAFRLGRR